MRAFVVLGLVFPHEGKRLAWGNVSEMTYYCVVGRKTLTHSLTHGQLMTQSCRQLSLLKMHRPLHQHRQHLLVRGPIDVIRTLVQRRDEQQK